MSAPPPPPDQTRSGAVLVSQSWLCDTAYFWWTNSPVDGGREVPSTACKPETWKPVAQHRLCGVLRSARDVQTRPKEDGYVPISRQDTKGTVCFKPLFILLLVPRRSKAAHSSREAYAAIKSDACLILKGVTDTPRDRVLTGYSKGSYLSWTLPGDIRQTHS